MSESKKRSNLWIFVGYPGDSLPDNFQSIVQSWHLQVLVSPEHDADLNADGNEKKKHRHFMIDFGSGQNKSFDQVSQYSSQLNATMPIICHSKNSMIRYFVHEDNPEKHHYDRDELLCFGGFDPSSAFDNYTSEEQMYKFVENIIFDNVIYNYAVLCRYLWKKGLKYELMFVRRHSIHFNSILNGQYQLLKQGRQIIVDTGSDIDEFVFIKDVNPIE